jgi:hypothetical protein
MRKKYINDGSEEALAKMTLAEMLKIANGDNK